MSLRKSPRLTPALVAAQRANARKSTGPRTPEGKARVALNSLKSGERARAFRRSLERAGAKEDVRLFDWILEMIGFSFQPKGSREARQAERLARKVWCCLRGKAYRESLRARPEEALESAFPLLVRFRVEDHRHGRLLVIWSQRSGRRAKRHLPLPRTVRPFAVWFNKMGPEGGGRV